MNAVWEVSLSTEGVRAGGVLLPPTTMTPLEQVVAYIRHEQPTDTVLVRVHDAHTTTVYELSPTEFRAIPKDTYQPPDPQRRWWRRIPLTPSTPLTPWVGSRTVMVANPKGGSGKTPLSILLAQRFAHVSGVRPLVWDLNPARGTLGWRTAWATHTHTVRDLINQLEDLEAHATADDLTALVHTQDDGSAILRGLPLTGAPHIEADTYPRILNVLERFFGLVIFDTGNDESHPAWHFAADHAAALVVPAATRSEHISAARFMLTDLDTHSETHHLAQDATMVLTQSSPKDPTPDQASADTHLGRPHVALAWDPAVAAAPLHLADTKRATQATIDQVAHQVRHVL